MLTLIFLDLFTSQHHSHATHALFALHQGQQRFAVNNVAPHIRVHVLRQNSSDSLQSKSAFNHRRNRSNRTAHASWLRCSPEIPGLFHSSNTVTEDPLRPPAMAMMPFAPMLLLDILRLQHQSLKSRNGIDKTAVQFQ